MQEFFVLGKWMKRALVSLLLLLSSSIVSADEAANLNLEQDPRLGTRVQVHNPRLRMAEMLEVLSTQTGVSLTIDSRTKGSGVPLVVSLSQQPLKSVMSALATVAGLRSHTWVWVREKVATGYTYRLEATDLDALAQWERNQTQDAFEKQAHFLIDYARMSPAERKRELGKNEANDVAAQDATVVSGARILGENVSEEQLATILRGGNVFQFPASSLSAESLKFRQQDSDRPDLLSDKVSVHVARDDNELSLCLYIDFGTGGLGYVGGLPLEKELRMRLLGEWIHRGDTPFRIEENRQYPVLKGVNGSVRNSGATTSPPISTPEGTLLEFAEAAQLPLIAIIPPGASAIDDYRNTTLPVYLQKIREGSLRLECKWNSKILLINHSAWFLHANKLIAFKTFKDLRQLARTEKWKGLQLLADTTFAMTNEQIEALQSEFPILQILPPNRPIFAMLHAFPHITRDPARTDIIPDMVQYLRAADSPTLRLPPQATVLRLDFAKMSEVFKKLNMRQPPTNGSDQVSLWIEFLDDSGNLKSLGKIPYPLGVLKTAK